MTMIEKVARAIAKARGNETTWKVWLDPARAALEAMREPSEDMVEAGFVTPNNWDHTGEVVTEVWTWDFPIDRWEMIT